MTNRVKVTAYSVNCFGDTWPEGISLIAFINKFSEVLNTIPKEHRAKARSEVTADCERDLASQLIEVYYHREKTEEEIAVGSQSKGKPGGLIWSPIY